MAGDAIIRLLCVKRNLPGISPADWSPQTRIAATKGRCARWPRQKQSSSHWPEEKRSIRNARNWYCMQATRPLQAQTNSLPTRTHQLLSKSTPICHSRLWNGVFKEYRSRFDKPPLKNIIKRSNTQHGATSAYSKHR